MIELYKEISFAIFENVDKCFSEFMKEKDIKLLSGESEGFASYCAEETTKAISRLFFGEHTIKRRRIN